MKQTIILLHAGVTCPP